MGNHNDAEHFVAWLDLLGFRQLIEEKSTADVAKLLEEDIPTALHKVVPKALLERGAIVYGDNRCEIEQFQDTLVLWTRDTEISDLEALLDVTAGMVCVLHMNGLPTRGGVSKGTLYTSRLNPNASKDLRVVVGRGVKRASDLEAGRAWAGVAIDPALAENEEIRLDVFEARKPSGRLTQYGKHREDDEDICLGWPSLTPHHSTEYIISKMWPQEPENARHRSIRDNTRGFIDWWRSSFGLDLDRIDRAAREFGRKNAFRAPEPKRP